MEATGSEKIANEAINYVRRGGTLMVYGVYDNAALVHWKPAKIFVDEIRVCHSSWFFAPAPILTITQIVGSFAQAHCFPRAVAYLDSGKIKGKGMVSLPYHRIVASDRI